MENERLLVFLNQKAVKNPLKLATACALIPLILGTGIYIAWRITRWDWLALAGYFLILVGLAFFALGTVLLVLYWRKNSRHEPKMGSRPLLKISLVSGLLLVNFPAAGFYAWSALDLKTRYTVQVTNKSKEPIDSFVLTGPGVKVELGPIASADHTIQHFHVAGEGPLNFKAVQGGLEIMGQIDGYVATNLGGNATVRILPGGQYNVNGDTIEQP